MVSPTSSTMPPNLPAASPIAISSPSMNRSTAIGTSMPAASSQRLVAIITRTPATKPAIIGNGWPISCSLGNSSIATAENTTPAAKCSKALTSALLWGRVRAMPPPITIAATGTKV